MAEDYIRKTVERLDKMIYRITHLKEEWEWIRSDQKCMDEYAQPLQTIYTHLVKVLDSRECLLIEDNWIHLFCRRLNRRLNEEDDTFQRHGWAHPEDEDEEWFVLSPTTWKSFVDVVPFVFDVDVRQNTDSPEKTRFEQIMHFEQDLEYRETAHAEFMRTRKSLSKLYETHKSFLHPYLLQCSMHHSKLIISGLGENPNRLLEKITTDKWNITSESRSWSSLRQELNRIKIPIAPVLETLNTFHVTGQQSSSSTETKFIPSLVHAHDQEDRRTELKISEILKNNPLCIVLGDPASGKTTLLRWLANVYASALVRQQETVTYTNDRGGIQSLGEARIPILIRIAEFAEWIRLHQTLKLFDYVGEHTWLGKSYGIADDKNILQTCIQHGCCLILLDGFDEIMNMTERMIIVGLIKEFLNSYVLHAKYHGVKEADDSLFLGLYPGYKGKILEFGKGNQVILSSRIVEYETHQLDVSPLALFYIRQLDETESSLFIDRWLMYVLQEVYCTISSQKLKCSLTDHSKQTIFDNLKKEIKKSLQVSSYYKSTYPYLLSLVCLLRLRANDRDVPVFRIAIYDAIVDLAHRSWLSTETTHVNFDRNKIDLLLTTMATYLHRFAPSGLIDEFDLKRLIVLSLKKNCSHGDIIDRNAMNAQAEQFLYFLHANTGVACARGLQTYGFQHLIFQEYFIAMGIVRPLLIERSNSSIMHVAESLLLCALNVHDREPLLIAMGWISYKLSTSEYNTLCGELIKKTHKVLTLGPWLLLESFHDNGKSPSIDILSQALDMLEFQSKKSSTFFHYIVQCLLGNLLPETAERVFQYYTLNDERLILFCRMVLDFFSFKRELPVWFSTKHYHFFWKRENKQNELRISMDLILRRFAIMNNRALSIPVQSLRYYFLRRHPLTLMSDKIHPSILTVIIALYGGLNRKTIDANNKNQVPFVEFDPNYIYRDSVLSPFIIQYLENKKDKHEIKKVNLIAACENILHTVDQSDTSTNTIDCIVALICLQNLSNLNQYKKLFAYKAFPIAIDQFKWILCHLRGYYYVTRPIKNGNAFRIEAEKIINSLYEIIHDKHQFLSIIEATAVGLLRLTTKHLSDSKLVGQYMLNMHSKHIPLNDELLRLMVEKFPNILRFVCCVSPERIVQTERLQIEIDQMLNGKHPLQVYQSEAFFLLSFISPNLVLFYTHLIDTARLCQCKSTQKTDNSFPYVIFLMDCLIYMDSLNASSDVRFSLLITIILPLFQQNKLGLYLMMLFSKCCNRKQQDKVFQTFALPIFSEQYGQRPDGQELVAKLVEFIETILPVNSDENDQHLGASSLCLWRMNTIGDGALKTFPLAERALLGIKNIEIVLCILINLVNSKCFELSQVQKARATKLLTTKLKELSIPKLSLLSKVNVFIRLIDSFDNGYFESTKKQLFMAIMEDLRTPSLPVDNENSVKDKQVTFCLLMQRLDTSYMKSYISVDERLLLLSGVDFRSLTKYSSSLHHSLDNIDMSSISTITLTSCLYLAELVVDVQLLHAFTSNNNSYVDSCSQNTITFIKKEKVKTTLTTNIACALNDILRSESSEESKLQEAQKTLLTYEDLDPETWPVFESWLEFRHDKRLYLFSWYAVILLLKLDAEAALLICNDLILDILSSGSMSLIDEVASLLCNAGGLVLSQNVWNALLLLEQCSSSPFIINVETTERFNDILTLEKEKIAKEYSSNMKSYLELIDYTSEDVIDEFIDYLLSVPTSQEEYVVTLLVRVAYKIFILREKRTIRLFQCIANFLDNTTQPIRIQVAAAIILGSVLVWDDDDQDKITVSSSKLLWDIITKASEKTENFDEKVIEVCLLAHVSLVTPGYPFQFWHRPPDPHPLYVLRDDCASTCISLKAAACLASRTVDWSLSDCSRLLQMFKLDIQVVYNVVIANSSYWLTNDHCRHGWRRVTYDLIIQHKSQLLPIFIKELYEHLTKNDCDILRIKPAYVQIAVELIENNQDDFCRTLRNINEINEDQMLQSLLQIKDERKSYCIIIYISLSGLTIEVIDMFMKLADVKSYMKFVKKVDDRSIIDYLFTLLGKASSRTHFDKVADMLISLVHTDIVTTHEIYENFINIIENNHSLFDINIENMKSEASVSILEHLTKLSCIRIEKRKENYSSKAEPLDIIDETKDFADAIVSSNHASLLLFEETAIDNTG